MIRNIYDPNLKCGISGATRNIGMRCKGKDCKWDDGSPITFTNFAGDGMSFFTCEDRSDEMLKKCVATKMDDRTLELDSRGLFSTVSRPVE